MLLQVGCQRGDENGGLVVLFLCGYGLLEEVVLQEAALYVRVEYLVFGCAVVEVACLDACLSE